MRKLTILLVILVLWVGAPAQTINDPNARLRPIGNFRALNLSSSVTVYLSQANDEMLAVSADNPADIDAIKTEIRNGVLSVRFEGKGNANNKNIKAYISFKQLDKIEASGNCDIAIVGEWKEDNVKITLTGASDFKGRLDAKSLLVSLSGASDMDIEGSTSQLDIKTSGASKFSGFNMPADHCTVKASGASEIKINISKELSVQASGASEIDYKGAGVIRDIKTSGVSSISKVKS